MTVESVFLSKAQCTGEVRLLGAHISGQSACDEATFTHPDGFALNADGVTVGNSMFLDKTRCIGEVPRPHRRPAELQRGDPPIGNARGADGMTVDGAMFLCGAQCTGPAAWRPHQKELLCGAGGLH